MEKKELTNDQLHVNGTREWIPLIDSFSKGHKSTGGDYVYWAARPKPRTLEAKAWIASQNQPLQEILSQDQAILTKFYYFL